ncbi:MAG: hypothetical protein ABIG10_02495 [bacterium]
MENKNPQNEEKILFESKIEQEPEENVHSLSQSKVAMMKKLANTLQDTAKQLSDLLTVYVSSNQEEKISLGQEIKPELSADSNQIIEGLFNGEKMIAEDGKEYNVPVNYASKSKLVEGDMLKLIITERGTFVYKQINPIERVRVVGKLEQGPTGEYYVSANDRRWRVLNASVTYFKGDINDEVIILIPRDGQSKWAAVENIIKKF